MTPDTKPGEDPFEPFATLLRQDADVPLGLRARVEAKVTRTLRGDGRLGWEARVALGAGALGMMGTLPGGLLAGPLIFVAWGVAAIYGALLDLEDEPAS